MVSRVAEERQLSFSGLLRSLERSTVDRLYDPSSVGSEWTCAAVIQMLDSIAQQIVVRILLSDENCLEAANSLGVLQSDRIISSLDEYGLLEAGRVRATVIQLLRQHIARCIPGGPWECGPNVKPEKKGAPSVAQLNQWMVWRWQTILIYVTGEEMDAKCEPHARIVDMLVRAALMRRDEELLEITAKGLEFLLEPRQAQIWILVTTYVDSEPPESAVDVLALLLTISFCAPGRPCAVAALNDRQRDALPVLGGLGLLYQRSKHSERFYPTGLGIQAAFPDDTQSKEPDLSLRIVVQTNFQVMAYTTPNADTSTLVVGMLSLFSSLRCRLPNLVVGEVTRSSIKACVERGIRIEQIHRFLKTHSDKPDQMPANVLDQMALWAGEDDRLLEHPGSLISLPASLNSTLRSSLYSQAIAALERRFGEDVVHWRDDSQCRFFVDDRSDHAPENFVRAFLAAGIQ